MTPELITALFTGLTGIIAALAAVTANRNRRIGEDQKVQKVQIRDLQRRLVATVEHVFALELEMAKRGIPIPPRPPILEGGDDDDDDPVEALAHADQAGDRAAPGRRRPSRHRA